MLEVKLTSRGCEPQWSSFIYFFEIEKTLMLNQAQYVYAVSSNPG